VKNYVIKLRRTVTQEVDVNVQSDTPDDAELVKLAMDIVGPTGELSQDWTTIPASIRDLGAAATGVGEVHDLRRATADEKPDLSFYIAVLTDADDVNDLPPSVTLYNTLTKVTDTLPLYPGVLDAMEWVGIGPGVKFIYAADDVSRKVALTGHLDISRGRYVALSDKPPTLHFPIHETCSMNRRRHSNTNLVTVIIESGIDPEACYLVYEQPKDAVTQQPVPADAMYKYACLLTCAADDEYYVIMRDIHLGSVFRMFCPRTNVDRLLKLGVMFDTTFIYGTDAPPYRRLSLATGVLGRSTIRLMQPGYGNAWVEMKDRDTGITLLSKSIPQDIVDRYIEYKFLTNTDYLMITEVLHIPSTD